MELIILFLFIGMMTFIIYKTPFATDNPMGHSIGKSILFVVNEINLKQKYIKGSFAIDGYIKNRIDTKILEFIDSYYISLEGNTIGLKKRINESSNIIWINDSKIYNLDGKLIN